MIIFTHCPKSIFYLLLGIFLAGCSQTSIQNNQAEPSISFDIDGKHYEHKGYQTATNNVGIFATKATGASGLVKTIYSFSAFLNNQNIFQLRASMDAPDTLRTITYSTQPMIRADDIVYGVLANNSVNIRITSYKDGVVNASFSGTVTKIISSTNTQTSTISNGEIKNVSVTY